MTKLLDKAIAQVRALPPAEQDEIAGTLLSLLDEEAQIVPLSDAERRAIARGRDAADRGRFTSDDEMKALWERYDA